MERQTRVQITGWAQSALLLEGWAVRGQIVAAVVVALALNVTASQGDWKLGIHKDGFIEEHPIAEIDSLTFYDDTTSVPSMVVVPAGIFIMGDGTAYCGVYEHEVTLTRHFYLCQHEVTNQEYLEVLQWAYEQGYVTATTMTVQDNLDWSTEELLDLDDDHCEIQFDGAGTFYLRESPSHIAQEAYPGGYDPSDHPVKEVSWYGSVRYCDWLSLRSDLPRAYEHNGDWACNGGDPYGAAGFRLPTDAEWEYAAQWDDERIYPWGNEAPDCSRANYSFCVGWTRPVGIYPDAPEALGLSDMAGNVWEWCNDWWLCDLDTDPATDPTGPPNGTYRVLRGSSFGYFIGNPRCAIRNNDYPAASGDKIGFRVARTRSE
jgi:formylglycine-generating enzyme required for sulfatase activity